jgi:gas vesicle protein
MLRLLRFVGGVLLGALVGGGLMLIFAPSSGTRTRQPIVDWLQAVWREGLRAADAERQDLVAQLEGLKSP